MGNSIRKLARFGAFAGAAFGAAIASAQTAEEDLYQGTGFLGKAATENAAMVHRLNDGVLYLMIAIVLFVMILMAIIMFRFREKKNPVPSKTSHNTLLEVVWTTVPVLIVLGLIAFATGPLYQLDVVENTEMTVKVTGNQWNWTYAYPDHGDFDYTSVILSKEDADAQGKPYLLGTDAPMVVPANTKIRVQVTGSDVLHSFAMPAFAVKIDAVPGRINETWFKVDYPGTYYGQCSEICGREHAYMPIEIQVLPKNEFIAWVKSQNPEYVQAPATVQEAALSVPASTEN